MNLFPVLNTDLQDQIDNINSAITTVSTTTVGKSFVFDYNTGQFTVEDGKLIETTKEQALKQWISLCVRTYTDKYNIYKDTGFGTYLDNVKGKKINSFYKTTIGSELKNGLTKNPVITDVNNIVVTSSDSKFYITANVKLADNSILDISEVV